MQELFAKASKSQLSEGSVRFQNFWSNAGQMAAIGMMASMPISRAVFNVCALVMITSWVMAGRYRSLNEDLFKQPALLMYIAFFLAVLVSVSYSMAPTAERWAQVSTYSKLLYIPIMVSLLRDKQWIRRGWVALTSGLFLLLALFIADFWIEIPGSLSARDGSIGVFNNTIVQGLQFAVLSILGIYFWSESQNRNSLKGWIFITLAFSAAIATIIFNPGRGAQLALLGGVVAFSFLSAPRQIRWIATATVILIFAAMALSSNNFTSRFETAVSEIKIASTEKNTSVGLRMHAWKTGISIWSESPFLGKGAGAYRHLMHTQYAEDIGGCPSATCEQPHNQFVFTLVEQGVFGLLILASLLIMSACAPTKKEKFLRAFSVAFITLFTIHSNFDSGLQMNNQVFVFIAVAGLIIATANSRLNSSS